MRLHRLAACAAICAMVGACDDGAVRWEPERRVPGAMAPGARMVLTPTGVPAVQAPAAPARWPNDSLACAASRMAIRGGGDTLLAAWWRSPGVGGGGAPDTLVAALAADGVVWDTARVIAVAAARCCRSAPPALAIDAGTGSAHVGFHGIVGLGAGFGLARLDRSGRVSRPPLVVWRERQARLLAVAAQGDTVAVAVEAASAAGSTIRLAISLSSPQIPLDCGAVASPESRAFAPVVALADGRVAVGWNEARRGDRAPAAVARVGEIRRACEPSR